jgi:hypothetical protein
MHCIAGVVINFDHLFIWAGIYLHLVTANKILTNSKNKAFWYWNLLETKS